MHFAKCNLPKESSKRVVFFGLFPARRGKKKYEELIRQMKIFIFLILICLFSASAFDCPAQTKKRNRLPRVAKIRPDEDIGAIRSGCDNHPITFTNGGDDLFFDSRGDGLDAYMNLNGHNVKLLLLKTTIFYLNDDYDTTNAIYEYRIKKTRITVSLRMLTDYTVWIPAKVVMRNGQAVRRFNAFVSPQCDAL